jgi:anti-anti-sigma regulatory factor
MTLSLYSNAKKDTDFAAVWKQLSEILPGTPVPRIAIDFGNVMFLYDRELQYLEKFRDVVLQAGGTIAFVNCEAELVAILSTNPRLASCVSGQGAL